MGMSTYEHLPKALHDAVINEIVHSLERPELTFLLSDNRALKFEGVILFRCESFFHLETISADKLYISVCDVSTQSALIEEVKRQHKADGSKKWGDQDRVIKMRSGPIVHLNVYCIDWEFDIVCRAITLTESRP